MNNNNSEFEKPSEGLRQHPRFKVNKEAKLKLIIHIGPKKLKKIFDCKLLDISQTGLLLELPNDTPYNFQSKNASYYIKFGATDREIFLVRVINSFKAAFSFVNNY